uniref:Uncharacterized protein n=1 Tax=Picea sitchensis TaxID=3332 RepID=D5AC83_PICSI|nr:unknown [Picea sitchensis]
MIFWHGLQRIVLGSWIQFISVIAWVYVWSLFCDCGLVSFV